MRTFQQNKLWRDKVVNMLQAQGSRIDWYRLNDTEFDQQLRTKLIEEAYEVISTKNIGDLRNEIADVYEVIDCLLALHNIDKNTVIAEQVKKRNERGSFVERKFVTVAQHPIGSFGEKYCLADPEKYPEITT